jgi:hypothetical protein
MDIYEHKTQIIENKSPLMIRVGTREDTYKQLDDIYVAAGLEKNKQTFLKFCPNIKKLELQNADKLADIQSDVPKKTTSNVPEKKVVNVTAPAGFSIKDIKL